MRFWCRYTTAGESCGEVSHGSRRTTHKHGVSSAGTCHALIASIIVAERCTRRARGVALLTGTSSLIIHRQSRTTSQPCRPLLARAETATDISPVSTRHMASGWSLSNVTSLRHIYGIQCPLIAVLYRSRKVFVGDTASDN